MSNLWSNPGSIKFHTTLLLPGNFKWNQQLNTFCIIAWGKSRTVKGIREDKGWVCFLTKINKNIVQFGFWKIFKIHKNIFFEFWSILLNYFNVFGDWKISWDICQNTLVLRMIELKLFAERNRKELKFKSEWLTGWLKS